MGRARRTPAGSSDPSDTRSSHRVDLRTCLASNYRLASGWPRPENLEPTVLASYHAGYRAPSSCPSGNTCTVRTHSHLRHLSCSGAHRFRRQRQCSSRRLQYRFTSSCRKCPLDRVALCASSQSCPHLDSTCQPRSACNMLTPLLSRSPSSRVLGKRRSRLGGTHSLQHKVCSMQLS